MAVPYGYLGYLRTGCGDGSDGCEPCECFPECFTGTELEATFSGAGPSNGITHTCSFFGNDYIYDFQFDALNALFILAYLGAGVFELFLAECDDAAEVRAGGLLVGTLAIMCAPASDTPDEIAYEEELYITAIEVTIACDGETMHIESVVFTMCNVIRNRVCTDPIDDFSGWIVQTIGNGLLFSNPAICDAFASTVSVGRCAKNEPMEAEGTRGEGEVAGDCLARTDCDTETTITIVAAVVDA